MVDEDNSKKMTYRGVVEPLHIFAKYGLGQDYFKKAQHDAAIVLQSTERGRVGRVIGRKKVQAKVQEVAFISSKVAQAAALFAFSVASESELVTHSAAISEREEKRLSRKAAGEAAKAALLASKSLHLLIQEAFEVVNEFVSLEKDKLLNAQIASRNAAEAALLAASTVTAAPVAAQYAAQLAAGVQRRERERAGKTCRRAARVAAEASRAANQAEKRCRKIQGKLLAEAEAAFQRLEALRQLEEARKLKEEAERSVRQRHGAAKKIQAHMRGSRERQQFLRKKKINQSATRIQARYRGFTERRRNFLRKEKYNASIAAATAARVAISAVKVINIMYEVTVRKIASYERARASSKVAARVAAEASKTCNLIQKDLETFLYKERQRNQAASASRVAAWVAASACKLCTSVQTNLETALYEEKRRKRAAIDQEEDALLLAEILDAAKLANAAAYQAKQLMNSVEKKEGKKNIKE
eukprot:g1465.t1